MPCSLQIPKGLELLRELHLNALYLLTLRFLSQSTVVAYNTYYSHWEYCPFTTIKLQTTMDGVASVIPVWNGLLFSQVFVLFCSSSLGREIITLILRNWFFLIMAVDWLYFYIALLSLTCVSKVCFRKINVWKKEETQCKRYELFFNEEGQNHVYSLAIENSKFKMLMLIITIHKNVY